MRFPLLAVVPLCAGLMAAPVLADVPNTPEQHQAMAKSYREKAADYRREASAHREMASDYKKSMPGPDKSGRANPWVTKMEKHCETIAADAERLAGDLEKAADFHELRAKEHSGK